VIFHDPGACDRVLRELADELTRAGAERLADVVGLAHQAVGGRQNQGPVYGTTPRIRSRE
jgi:hypothetical protein